MHCEVPNCCVEGLTDRQDMTAPVKTTHQPPARMQRFMLPQTAGTIVLVYVVTNNEIDTLEAVKTSTIITQTLTCRTLKNTSHPHQEPQEPEV